MRCFSEQGKSNAPESQISKREKAKLILDSSTCGSTEEDGGKQHSLGGSERHRFASFRKYRASLLSSRFVDMLVAARIDTTVLDGHLGSSEDTWMPSRVYCAVLTFRRLVCILVL